MDKIAADMYPLNELREEFSRRIRATGFTDSHPNIVVSFKLFSNIVPSIDNASQPFSEVIEKALSELSIYCTDGKHQLQEVDYMFFDDNGQCVIVLNNGNALTVLNADIPMEAESLDDIIVSTSALKDYYLNNQKDFPFLSAMASEIDNMGITHSEISQHTTTAAQKCITNDWIKDNIDHCIDELQQLLCHASFILKKRKQTKSDQ